MNAEQLATLKADAANPAGKERPQWSEVSALLAEVERLSDHEDANKEARGASERVQGARTCPRCGPVAGRGRRRE